MKEGAVEPERSSSVTETHMSMTICPNPSPVTGVIQETEVVIDFGKYEGRTVQDVATLDPEFYQRLVEEKENGIFAIRRNRDKTFRLYINPLMEA